MQVVLDVVTCCYSSRKTRGAEFGLLTSSGHLLEDDAVTVDDDQSSAGGATSGCETRYQTSVVDVYATFSVSDTPHSRYLVRHGAHLRVTDLVRSELRVADPSLATFTDGNLAVEGLHPGQTQVQVRQLYVVTSETGLFYRAVLMHVDKARRRCR